MQWRSREIPEPGANPLSATPSLEGMAVTSLHHHNYLLEVVTVPTRGEVLLSAMQRASWLLQAPCSEGRPLAARGFALLQGVLNRSDSQRFRVPCSMALPAPPTAKGNSRRVFSNHQRCQGAPGGPGSRAVWLCWGGWAGIASPPPSPEPRALVPFPPSNPPLPRWTLGLGPSQALCLFLGMSRPPVLCFV